MINVDTIVDATQKPISVHKKNDIELLYYPNDQVIIIANKKKTLHRFTPKLGYLNEVVEVYNSIET